MHSALIRLGIVVALIGIVGGLAAWAVLHDRNAANNTYPPVGNHCYESAQELLAMLRQRGDVTVPAFTAEDVRMMECAAVRGTIQFEIAGIAADGADFRVNYLAGGVAASGADSISDYCYISRSEIVSGKRITGREGAISSPRCAFDVRLTAGATDTYRFGAR